jgi:hypothetical protein
MNFLTLGVLRMAICARNFISLGALGLNPNQFRKQLSWASPRGICRKLSANIGLNSPDESILIRNILKSFFTILAPNAPMTSTTLSTILRCKRALVIPFQKRGKRSESCVGQVFLRPLGSLTLARDTSVSSSWIAGFV